MENGDHARLEQHDREIAALRDKAHKHATNLTTLNLKVDMLERSGGKTATMLDRWKDVALGAAFTALIFMVLHFGLPKL